MAQREEERRMSNMTSIETLPAPSNKRLKNLIYFPHSNLLFTFKIGDSPSTLPAQLMPVLPLSPRHVQSNSLGFPLVPAFGRFTADCLLA